MKLVLAVVLVCFLQSCQADSYRAGRLFFATVSSSTSTSTSTVTLETTSLCYTTSGTASACTSGKKRRKRMADLVGDSEFKPTPVRNSEERLFPSEDSRNNKLHRDARLFLLATSTSTVTATATTTTSKYTATLSLTLNCIPSSISFCG